MKKVRTSIPAATANSLLFANRHRCCVCREPRKPVQLHHLDGAPTNHAWTNLAVLCLDHHSDATGSQGLGKNYSAEELLLFKENWEQQCKIWRESHDDGNEDEDDAEIEDLEPIHTVHKRLILKEDQVESYRFQLDRGDEIAFSFSSDEPIDFLIMHQSQYKRWDDGEDFESEDDDEGIMERNDSFVVPRKGWWAVVFHNPYDEPAELEYDIGTWPPD